jgi:iron complex transport system ATP-binding protein
MPVLLQNFDEQQMGLHLKAFSIGYGEKPLRSNIDFVAQNGELTCLLGANGCGKSTLFKTLMGDLPPLGGEAQPHRLFSGQSSARERAKGLATILTQRRFPDFLKVEDYVLTGRYPHLGPWSQVKTSDWDMVHQSLGMVGGEKLASRWVSELSDGERQRVVLAKALAQDAKVLLLDEPTAYLDVPHKAMTFEILRRWTQERSATVIMSTHDIEFALSYADHLWLMGEDFNAMGSPEDLYLSGQLSSVFQHHNLRFNEEGRLEFYAEPCVFIDIQVPEPHQRLASKALLREGYGHQTGAELQLKLVQLEPQQYQWQLCSRSGYHFKDSVPNGQEPMAAVCFAKLHDLCRYLRSHVNLFSETF